MDDKNLAGTLGTLGLMPKEGGGYTRITPEILKNLEKIGVDHKPFLDALFGTEIITGLDEKTGILKTERKSILGELDNTTTPFEATQYIFGIPLAAIGTYLNELTKDVNILSAMGKLSAWERHYNNMESMLPSLLTAMLLGGSEGDGNGGTSGNGRTDNENQRGISKEYAGKMKSYLAQELGQKMVQDLFKFTDYLNKAYKNGKNREDCLYEMGEFTKYMVDQKKGVQPTKEYANYLKNACEFQGDENMAPERYGSNPRASKENDKLLGKYMLKGNGNLYGYRGLT
ncbi:MAG: hypothetical protein KAT28_01725 [Candidatus Aenigmarchaeota archaeon]|nr:hypothetical protein [Candidatus Aenigmarchaeota archaeon]